MSEIAYTNFGRNALVIGLISHVTALLVAMIPVSASDSFFSMLYPFYWITIVSGVYKELRDRGYKPFGNWRYYILMAATIVPILGPTAGLMALYGMQGYGKLNQDKPLGFLTSALRLRANMLVIFLFLVIVFILFAGLLVRNDPYFKRKAADCILPRAALAAEKSEFIHFVSEEKHFSVHLPSNWGKDESFFLKEYKEYGVRLWAPGMKDLEYVLIDVAYYAQKHRTYEKFIFDKLNPALSPPG